MSSEPFFDTRALEKLEAVGGAPLVVRMLDLFLQLAPQRLADARAALASSDLVTVERLTHSLKSSAANVGAHRLQERAEEAEQMASRKGDPEGLGAVIEVLFAELEFVRPTLEAERQRRLK